MSMKLGGEAAKGEVCSFDDERAQYESTICDLQNELEGLYETLERAMESSHRIAFEAEVAEIESHQIFQMSHDAIWVLDAKFRIQKINNSFLNILGCSSEDIIGKKCSEVFCHERCGTSSCILQQVLKKPKNISQEVEVEIHGEKRIFSLNASPFMNVTGDVSGCIQCFRDITARKQAEKCLKEANTELEKLAIKDGMTGLNNRRNFDKNLESEWRRGLREQTPMSLLMCDVDHFKLYNDYYGHQQGDECLKLVAEALRTNCKRPADFPARYGGEEFAIILPNTPQSGAEHVAELIRKTVQDMKIEHEKSLVIPFVTLCIGIATTVPSTEKNPESLLLTADNALYKAKENGRNCVVTKEL